MFIWSVPSSPRFPFLFFPDTPPLLLSAALLHTSPTPRKLDSTMSGQSGAPPLAPTHNLTETQQEALLKAKYGGLLPKKKIAPKDHKYFDSADWALSKQLPTTAAPSQENGAPQRLAPKTEPTLFPPRRASQLGEGQ